MVRQIRNGAGYMFWIYVGYRTTLGLGIMALDTIDLVKYLKDRKTQK